MTGEFTKNAEQTANGEELLSPNGDSLPPADLTEPFLEKTNEPLDEKSQIAIDLGLDDSDYDTSRYTRFIKTIEDSASSLAAKWGGPVRTIIKILLFVAYLVYFGFSMKMSFGDEDSIMLLVITVIIVLVVLNKFKTSRGCKFTAPAVLKNCLSREKAKSERRIIRYALYIITGGGISAFLCVDVLQHNPRNLQSFFGMLGFIFISFICSYKPSKVNWHPVFWGCVIQFGCAILTLKTQVGYTMFAWMGRSVEDFISFSDAGAAFVMGKDFKTMGLLFAFAGVIIFFNSFMFLLNHWGVVEFIVVKLGYFLSLCMETGPVESVVAAANIFIGMAEAPLLIRPYLPTVTKSEIHTIMTCGFASIAGAAMGLFIRFGAPANHLLTAAVISAPAALAMSKLIYPEIKKVDFSKQREIKMRDPDDNRDALSACADGAVLALTMLGAIMATMISFFSLLHMCNIFLTWFGERVGFEGLTFEMICSWVLFPVAYLMGVDVMDCGQVGALIGTKLFATPVLGYAQLGIMIKNRLEVEDYMISGNGTWRWEGQNVVLDGLNKTLEYGFVSERSEVIATYAMCGFSAFTAIGICLGTLTSLCPPRKKEIIELVMRAFLAGNMASFLTGAVAGVMYTGD